MPSAESSTAPLLSEAVAALSPSDRAQWKLTGELPTTSRTTDADSSPAEPDVQAAEIAATHSADSEPAPSKKTRGNADTRKAELQAEIDALLKRRAELRSEVDRPAPPASAKGTDAKAESSPAPDAKSLAEIIRTPDISKPPMDEEAFWAKHPEAKLADFNRYLARYEMLWDRADQARTATEQSGRDRYQSSFTKALEADPELREKIPEPMLKANPVISDRSGPLDFAAAEIQDSEHGAAMWNYLGDHPDEVERLQTMRTPAAVIRAMARIEAKVSDSTSPKPTATTKSRISSAPPPMTSLGRKNAAPANEALAAVADGDVRRFMDVENRRELARRRSG